MIRRNAIQTLLVAGTLPAALVLQAQNTQLDVATLLRRGGCALMLRHAQTVAGIGDPPEFKLDQCNTQRNLNDEGRDQAKRIGQWFDSRNLRAASVQSSAWCRCKDTAELAFGRFGVLPALNSTFDDRAPQAAQTDALRKRLKSIAVGHFEVWITHQVNVTAMTNEFLSMGEAFVVKLGSSTAPASVLGRTTFG